MKRKYRLNRFLTVELVHVMAARGDCITDYGYQTTIRMRYLEPHDMVRTFDHEMCHGGGKRDGRHKGGDALRPCEEKTPVL